MKNTLITKLKPYLTQFIIVTIMILIIFGIFIFLDRPYILNNDQQLEYNIFYKEWIRLLKDFIKTGQFPFYSWYKFLGSDFYSSANIFVTGDIFIPLLMLFRDVSKGLMVESILLIYISSFTFRYFLSSFDIKDNWNKTIISIIYAFSGLAILYYGNYMFHRFYAFMPLLFACVENYLQRDKVLFFSIVVALLFITSIYFLFPTSLFLIIYFVFAYLRNGNAVNVYDFIQKSFKLILYYILGFLLSSFISLPAILTLLNNTRIGAPYDPFLTWDLKVSIGFIISHIAAPFALFTDIPYMFASGFNGHAMWYSVYASAFSLLIFLYYFLFITDRNKKYFSFLYLSTLFIIFFKPLNSVFHGFSEPTFRFVFLYVFVILLITAYVIENFKNIRLHKSYLIFFVVSLLSFITLYQMQIFDFKIYTLHISFIYLSLFFGLITCLFFKSKYIYLFILIELTLNASLIIYTHNKPYYTYTPSITQEYLDYYTKVDEDIFYRIYIDPKHLLPTNNFNLNQSLNYRYHSTSTYDTNYEGELHDFLHLNGFDWHIIHINNPELLSLLGVKYYIAYDEVELPDYIETSYVYDLDFLKVYKDNDFKSIGFTYNKFKFIENISDSQIVNWKNELLIYYKDSNIIENIPYSDDRNYFDITSKRNNSLTGTITSSNKTLLFLSIPYNEGWRIQVNGKETKFFKVHGGFIGIPLETGMSNIEMDFTPKGFVIGFTLSLIASMILLFLKFKQSKFTNKNSMK